MRAFAHAHVVGFRGAFHATSSGEMWLVMEHCEDGSLLDVARATADGRLADADASAALGDSATGLAYLHSQKAIHRDVKAANLLLAADGAVKLADFGVSALSDATLARAMTVIGTPHWMAPEVIKGAAPYDARADVWSLGITAISSSTAARRTSSCRAARDVYDRQRGGAEPRRRGTRRRPRHLRARCLEKSPAERATCAQLLEEAPLPADRPRLRASPTPPSPPPPPPPPLRPRAAARRRTKRRRGEWSVAFVDDETRPRQRRRLGVVVCVLGTVVRHPSPSGTFVRRVE